MIDDGRCLVQEAAIDVGNQQYELLASVLFLGRRMVGFVALEKDLAIAIEAVVAKGIKDLL